jgi:geranylgeranyl diphosphate synthase type I
MTAAAGAGIPDDLVFVTSRLRPYLAGLLECEQAAWKEYGAPWPDVPRALAGYLDGGKALRPRFCYWGYAAAGRRPGPRLLRACAAVEILHAFALIHDDLMDGSPVRRGAPSLHRQLAAQHRRAGWAGDPDGYGQAVAMLTGDYALALASRLAATLPPRPRLAWGRMVAELTVGQSLDLGGAARRDRSAELARTTAVLKSGRYTVTGPLRLGAAVAGHAGLPEILERYGDLVGEAFQLRDDLLGVFGDPRRTGKPAGEDLRAGKPTELMAAAAAMLPPRRRPLLSRAGSPSLTEAETAELAAALAACGARQRIERRIAANVRAGCALARRAAVPARVREALCQLAAAAADRQQ